MQFITQLKKCWAAAILQCWQVGMVWIRTFELRHLRAIHHTARKCWVATVLQCWQVGMVSQRCQWEPFSHYFEHGIPCLNLIPGICPVGSCGTATFVYILDSHTVGSQQRAWTGAAGLGITVATCMWPGPCPTQDVCHALFFQCIINTPVGKHP